MYLKNATKIISTPNRININSDAEASVI